MQNSRPSSIHDIRYQNVIKLIISARKDKNFSQLELAEKLGFSQPDISKIERMERRIDIIELLDFLNLIAGDDIEYFDKLWKKINEYYRKPTSS
jgi:transcriptional regulator with XRE-family HTH domain